MPLRTFPGNCPCTAARRASRAITQLYDLVLSPTGLKATQFIVLSAIAREREIAQCRLAKEYTIAVETLSRRLSGLRRKGLIQSRDGFPHHQHVYSLTDKGRGVYEAALPYWNRAQARLNATMGENEIDFFLNLCERVVIGARQAQSLRVANGSPTIASEVREHNQGAMVPSQQLLEHAA